MIDLHDMFSARRWISLAAMIVLASGTAQSMSADDDKDVVVELRGDFDRPLGADDEQEQNEPNGLMNVTSVMTHTQNGRTFTVKINNGKITVERDGRELRKDEYRKREGAIDFLDKEGNVEHSMQLPRINAPDVFQIMPRAGGKGGILRLAPDMVPVAPQPENPPPVMLGVTLSDDDDGVRIDSVREGLPADKAGLRAGDVILRIDNVNVKERADITDYLRTRQPGDKVELVVERDGQRLTQVVKLEKWDGGRMGAIVVPDAPAPPGFSPDAWFFGMDGEDHGEAREVLREARKGLEAALDRINAARGDAGDRVAESREAMKKALDQLRKAEELLKQARGTLRLRNLYNERVNNLLLPQVNRDDRAFRRRLEEFVQGRGGAEEEREGMDALRKEIEALREEVRRMRDEARQKRDER